MRKKGILLIFFGITCFIIIIAADFVTGESIFKTDIQPPFIFKENNLGPFYLSVRDGYSVSISINFKGKLSSEFNLKIVDERNNNVWSSGGYIKGVALEKNGNSVISMPPFKTISNGNHYVLFKLLHSKYNCEISRLSISLRKNVICVSSNFLIISELIVVFGIFIFLKGMSKKSKLKE